MLHSSRRIALNTAAGWMANITKVATQLVMLPVMARLLGPAEFGLYALALPTISLFLVLADGGLGISLAREDESAVDVWSTAFWVLLGTGFVLSAVVTCWGSVLSVLTHEPRLFGLMAFLSISLPLITLSVLPSARLTRRGNLMVYAFTDAAATLLGSLIAVALALHGAGAWSLAAQYLSVFVVRAVVLNSAAFSVPRRVLRFATLRPHLATGSSVLGGRLSDFASRLLENVLLSEIFGPAGLGNYTFANQTSRFLCEAASNPLWATLYAQGLHLQRADIAPLHAKLSRVLAMLIFPVTALLTVAAPEILAALLGPRWANAALLLQLVLPSYALTVVAYQGTAVLLANGNNMVSFYATAANGAGRVLSVSLGLWTGLPGVGIGVAVSNLLYSAFMFAVVRRVTGASPWLVIEGLWAPAASSAFSALVCWATSMALGSGSLGATVTALMAGGFAYLLMMIVLGGARLRTDLAVIERMVMRRGTAGTAGRS